MVEKPTTLVSSSGSASGTYEAKFRHSFTGASGKGSGVDRANINEKFDSLSVDTDFGKFTLQANAAGSLAARAPETAARAVLSALGSGVEAVADLAAEARHLVRVTTLGAGMHR